MEHCFHLVQKCLKDETGKFYSVATRALGVIAVKCTFFWSLANHRTWLRAHTAVTSSYLKRAALFIQKMPQNKNEKRASQLFLGAANSVSDIACAHRHPFFTLNRSAAKGIDWTPLPRAMRNKGPCCFILTGC